MKDVVSGHYKFGNSEHSSPQKRTTRFIPPSQQKNLPRNIIVTSVNLEAVEWGLESSPPASKAIAAAVTGEFVPTQRALPDPVSDAIRWEILDRNWENYPLAKRDHVKVGQILLWKVCRGAACLTTL